MNRALRPPHALSAAYAALAIVAGTACSSVSSSDGDAAPVDASTEAEAAAGDAAEADAADATTADAVEGDVGEVDANEGEAAPLDATAIDAPGDAPADAPVGDALSDGPAADAPSESSVAPTCGQVGGPCCTSGGVTCLGQPGVVCYRPSGAFPGTCRVAGVPDGPCSPTPVCGGGGPASSSTTAGYCVAGYECPQGLGGADPAIVYGTCVPCGARGEVCCTNINNPLTVGHPDCGEQLCNDGSTCKPSHVCQ